jgi:Tfp pilus assembly protein PilP
MRRKNNYGIFMVRSFLVGASVLLLTMPPANAGISSSLPASALVSAPEKKQVAPKTPAVSAPAKTQSQPSMADITAAKAALMAPPDTYRYSSIGKTDPFKPFMDLEPKPLKMRAKAIPLSPLQRLDVEQFTLVGIAGNQKGRAAMVEDRKDKKFYPLFVGTSIGQNHGRVIEILADRVIVEEKQSNAKAKRIVLLLHREEEVKP